MPVLVAGEDNDAVGTVAVFARAIGFEAIVAGGLSNARYLEPLAELMIQLGYGLGDGDKIGFGLLKEARAVSLLRFSPLSKPGWPWGWRIPARVSGDPWRSGLSRRCVGTRSG
ncbi:hypothetical protein G6M84_12660 [Agrobacterium tumefaciens]|uniref:hypothetical protein n=1 Tax=Agrobacterium tumefaciens TaxID=358 RepID=UPI001574EC7D|nr:hypothetical protein [Agrobacterium tumefaciens]NTB97342.1 hypothetical protein [Agrobacterium tumefaciens]NTC45096.1 hypothetical protein [Agrobacterium tumefaciens]